MNFETCLESLAAAMRPVLLVMPLTLLAAAPAFAQSVNVAATSTRPSVVAVRIDPSEAPEIDGDLSDPVWAKANIVDELRQVRPILGELGTERTVLRILYDENNLYFGAYVYETDPELITVRTMARDGGLGAGDSIRFILDPGITRRNAYTFQISPSGGRVDALLQNNTDNLPEWNTIWTLRTRIVDDGWIAELAIPFRSLSYDRDQPDWGFEFTRQIRHKSETLRWSNYSPTISFTDVSQAGTLTGIRDVAEGLGLEVQVYGATRVKQEWQTPERTSLSGTVGGNAYYKFTPALTGTLTLNPDFSDAPLDIRQVNTTRFSLFTPETRNFFLQDIPAFEFGGRNFSDTNNASPFFSRNIGLIKGIPVGILAGGKLSGELAGFGIGALSVYTNETATTPGQLLSVVRINRRILSESRVGIIVTNGDPTGLSNNSVLGADVQYRESSWLGEYVLQADAYYERSFSNTEGGDDSFGGAINFPNEPWGGSLVAKQIGRQFKPALGFANRTGIRQYVATVRQRNRFRETLIQELVFVSENNIITDLNDNIETRKNSLLVEVVTTQRDVFSFGVANFFEAVPITFDLPNDVPIPVGRYNWTNIGGRIQTANPRQLQATLEVWCCSFYDGDGVETDASIAYRPNQYFEFRPRYQGTFINLPSGSVDIHVVTVNAVVNFTPDMQVAIQAQYDNISENFGFLARYRWEFLPGSELFVALGQSAIVPERKFIAQTTQFSVRIGHTIRL